MTAEPAFGTDGAFGAAHFCLVVHEIVAFARSQLCKCSALGAGKGFLGDRDVRPWTVEDAAMAVCGYGIGDDGGVNFLEDVFVTRGNDDAIGEERRDRSRVFRCQSLFHAPWAGRRSDDVV